jgi:hypothetical protein
VIWVAHLLKWAVHANDKGAHNRWKVVLALVIIWYLYSIYSFAVCTGPGGIRQHVPDAVSSDEPIVIGLEIYLGPCETKVEDEYEDVKLYYRLVGAGSYDELTTYEVIPKGRSRDVYEFAIPPQGGKGEIEVLLRIQTGRERRAT